jgi:hypothetical protein
MKFIPFSTYQVVEKSADEIAKQLKQQKAKTFKDFVH